MAEYKLGKICPIFRGNWSSYETYDRLDVVTHNLISYVSLVTDNESEPSLNNNTWQVVAKGATTQEVITALRGSNLQLGELVAQSIDADEITVDGKDVATEEYVTNAIRYGIDEVSIDQTGTDRVNIETTMIGGGGSSSSILSATSTRAGVMTAADKAKLDAIADGGEHPIGVEGDATGDLDISDEAGYVLGRFENGHIRTKNFYSGNIYTKSEVDTLIGSSGGGGVTPQQLQDGLATKQDKLTSGTNIKTINNQSILGSGNINISGGSSSDTPLHLKILVIGNSYSYDSFMYMPFILNGYGITIELGIYYRANGSIANHVSEWTTTGYTLAHIDTSLGETAWTVNSGYGPKKSVEYTDWDIIVLQQGSSASTSLPYSSTRTLIIDIDEAYKAKFNKAYQLGWNININRASSGSDYTAVANTILSNIKTVCDTQPINIIFPYGTAIFDARTNSTLQPLGAGGNLWASDTIHLQEGLPCYLANIANIQALFNKFYPKYSVIGETIGSTITQSMINGWNVQNQNGTCAGISEDNCRLAQICAIVANRYNFEIKTIS